MRFQNSSHIASFVIFFTQLSHRNCAQVFDFEILSKFPSLFSNCGHNSRHDFLYLGFATCEAVSVYVMKFILSMVD
jgi:hypothetical protein